MHTLSHMSTTASKDQLPDIVRRPGGFTAREAAQAGMHSQALTRLVQAGVLERVARGQYRLAGAPVTEHHALAVAARAAPRGVICLLSALSFHGIGTQLPAAVWLAVERRARTPALRNPRLRVARFSGTAFTEGVEEHVVEGQRVRVYGLAKTIADLFKYRRKIGLDVALEALREAWQERRVTMGEIDRFARVCRVERVMTPYLEALVA
jgi:predicted transcriptional regulator of viral defense system